MRVLQRRGWIAAGGIALALAACGDGEREASQREVPREFVLESEREGVATDVKPVVEVTGIESAPVVVASYADAERAFRAGDFVQATALFEQYRVRKPENPWGHYMLGISAWRLGNHELAESALRRTIEVDSTHGKGTLNLARVLLERGQAADALPFAERFVAMQPESIEGWRVLGNARADLGMTEEALAAYREALVRDHSDAWTMNNLGVLLIRAGRYQEALRPLARATELRPDVARFHNNLGLALERTGYPAQAAASFQAALLADSTYANAGTSLERVQAFVTGTSETLDLAGMASSFALEIEEWKREREA